MGDVIPFKKIKTSVKHKGNTLCRSGFHQWKVIKKQRFDVKQGQLVTVYQCQRCHKIKNKLS
jgi:cytochrome c2